MKRKILIFFLFLVFGLAYFLRVFFLKDLSLTFGYDQARDAIISQSILKGDLKILGPPTSTPGLYHGVFYYYLLSPGYLLGKGSPIIAAYWMAIFNAAVVFVVFVLSFLLSKKSYLAAFLAAILYAVSFEATQYATWLSNPTVGIFTVPLMYLGLWLWLNSKNKFAPVIAALGLGLSIQSEIFLAYHIVPLAIWLWVGRKSILKKQLVTFAIVITLTLSTLILSEIKFGFKSIGGLKMLVLGGGVNLAYAKSVGDYLILYLNQIGRIFAFNSYPGNIGYGGGLIIALILVSIVSARKFELTPKLFLVSWLLSHLTVVSIGGTSTPFLMVGIGPAVSLILAIYLFEWYRKGYRLVGVLLFVILMFGNLSMIFRQNPSGSTLFAIQKDMLIKKQIALIDYTYQEAKGLPFSVNSLTSPLWINITWTYLYKWYGGSKYGYIPEWHGRNQIGQLDTLPGSDPKTKNYFLILEPMGGIPPEYLPLTIGEEDSVSKLVEEKNFGELVVQKRTKL